MLAKNTSGAVHLTSLDLDISQIQEDIRQVQQQMNELSEIALNTGEKVRNAFNSQSGSKPKLFDSSEIVREANEAKQSIESLRKSLSKTITADSIYKDNEAISKLIGDLELSEKAAETAEDRLSEFFSKIGEYQKVSISSSGGDLFRAIITSSDEAGQSIQRVYNLTKEFDKSLQSTTVVDNIDQRTKALEREAKALEKEAKEAERAKEQAENLGQKFESLTTKSANLVKTFTSSDIEYKGLEKLIENAKKIEEQIKAASSVNVTPENFKEVEKNYKNFLSVLERLKTEWADIGTVSNEQRKEILLTAEEIQNLALRYSNFTAQLASSNIKDFGIDDITKQSKEAKEELKGFLETLESVGKLSKEDVERFNELSRFLQTNKIVFGDTKTAFNELQKSLSEVGTQTKTAISDLKVLEKSATFSNSRKEAAALRTEFEKLYSEIKSGNISLETAQSSFSTLDDKFKNFSATVRTGTTALQNWVDKISESTKWQVANQLLNVVQQDFSNVFSTITDTEEAVIELRRVLSDAPLGSEISEELYQIAYNFGQTFENVQEVAVRFAQTGMEWNDVLYATRTTMLGLNTAELEVTSATQGLIAVMAQFNIDAADLEEVIDKINITADNFPVTSENIVAALQRAGGTASAFGLSLKETIGIITALSEATGRSGEAIGTAMNSLISFSMKDTALEKFSEFLGKDVSDYGVLELWQELSVAINGGNRELAKMMSQSQEFADLMDETLATSVGLEEEYTLALKEQNQMLKDGKDIYSTVGTYRQNYFIALLKNIGIATEAIEGMDNALGNDLGYSMQENKTAMEAFSKQWNQLVVSAQELAVQFGEDGFLDLAKDFTTCVNAALRLTKSIGGLTTVFLSLGTAILAIKREKLNKMFDNAIAAAQLFAESIKTGELSIKGFLGSLKNLKVGFGTVVTAITAAITVYNIYKSAVDEARQANIDAGKAAAEEANEIIQAYKAYETAKDAYDGTTEASQNYEKASSSLKEELKRQGVEVENLATAYDNATDSIKNFTDAELEKKLGEVTFAIEEQKKKFEDWANGFLGLVGPAFAKITQEENGQYSFSPIEIDSFEEGLSLYEEYKKIIDDIVEKKGGEAAAHEEAYKEAQKGKKILEEQFGAYFDLTEQAEKIRNQLDGVSTSGEEASNSLESSGDSASNTALAMEDLAERIEGLQSSFDNLNKEIDGFQSAYATIQEVIEEYNETGVMTADMMQSLIELEPEYIDLLEISAESISINEEKLSELIKTNDDRIAQLQAVKFAEEAAAFAQDISRMATEGMTEAQIVAAITTQALAGDIEKTAYAFLTGKASASDMKKALSDFAKQCDITGESVGIYTGKLYENIAAQATLNSLFDRIPGEGDTTEITPEMRNAEKYSKDRIDLYYKPSSSKKSGSDSSSSKSTKDPFEEKLKAEKEALDALIDSYEHQIFLMERNSSEAKEIAQVYRDMQKTVHEQAEKYRNMGLKEESEQVRSMQKLWWEYQDSIEEVLQGIYEATVEANENALSLLENQYEKAMERMDYSEMSTNLQKQLEYQKKIQEEAHKEAERLRRLGVDENSEAIQDCIDAWWKADDAIQEINSKIEESILSAYDDFIDLADEFDLWDYMDFTKVDYLKAKLDDINKLLREGTISLKEYNELLRQWNVDMFNAQKQLIQQKQEDVKKRSDEVVKGYEAEIKALDKRKDEVEAYYDGVIKGYEAEIDALEKRKKETEDYYDSLIDSLNEVQEANDRINAQIDYYNERQKIITNLEQAQARSGVAWREKEMEYQQQLIDLDEDWNRTQQDWKIEDQIDQLQKLKEQATADIDATIEKVQQSIEAAEEASKAAVDAIEQEIAGIEDTIVAVEEQAELEIQALEEQIKNLSQQFAEAIKSGMSDGLIDSKEEFDKAITDGRDFLLSTIEENSGVMKENAEETAEGVMFCYNHSFMSPFKSGIDDIAEHMKGSIQSGAKTSAESALKAFETSFVSPLKSSIASLISEVQKINISYNAKAASFSSGQSVQTQQKGPSFRGSIATGNRRTIEGAPTTVYISNYNSTSDSAANKTMDILQQIIH